MSMGISFTGVAALAKNIDLLTGSIGRLTEEVLVSPLVNMQKELRGEYRQKGIRFKTKSKKKSGKVTATSRQVAVQVNKAKLTLKLPSAHIRERGSGIHRKGGLPGPRDSWLTGKKRFAAGKRISLASRRDSGKGTGGTMYKGRRVIPIPAQIRGTKPSPIFFKIVDPIIENTPFAVAPALLRKVDKKVGIKVATT